MLSLRNIHVHSSLMQIALACKAFITQRYMIMYVMKHLLELLYVYNPLLLLLKRCVATLLERNFTGSIALSM
jgi:hypothetical protein